MNAGHQKARAREWALGRAGTGTEQVAVDFELVETGEHITWYGSLSDKAFDRTIESLRHCGWEGDDLSDLAGLNTNEVSLDIDWDDYNGERRLRVNWVNRPGGVALKDQMSNDEARAFALRMKSRIASIGKTPKPRQPAAAPKKPPTNGNDDLPF